MFRWRPWRQASGALASLLLGLTSPAEASATARDPVVESAVVLAATVDGLAVDEPVIVRRHDGRVWIAAADLRTLGIEATNATDDIALDAVPGLTFTIDDAAQTIALHRASGATQHIRIARSGPEDTIPITPNGWGGVLNYEATAGFAPGSRSLGGIVDATLYTPRGFAFAGVIAEVGNRQAQRRIVRTDTGYTLADPDRLLRLTVGDFVNASTDFSRSVRMGGVKIGTDFGLRPDLVTFPLPSINGSAAVPSAVDLVVNGHRRAAGEVRAGQFALSDIPVVTGVNTVTVAVRDSLGRQTTQTVATYASRALLRRGLSAWSAEVGAVRTGFAGANDRYRALAASGSLRHGLTDRLTLEAHGEGGASLLNLGVGGSLSLGRFGLLDVSAAASRSRATPTGRPNGHQVTIGLERIARPISLSARYTRNSRGWTDLANRYGSVTRRHSLVLNIGFDLGRVGTIGVGVIDLGRGRALAGPDLPSTERRLTATEGATLLNASYSAHLGRGINLVGNVGADLRRSRSLFASLGVLVTLGSRSSGYGGVTVRDRAVGGSAEYTRNALVPGQFGYRASVAAGAFDRVAGAVEYLGTRGHVDAQLERTNGEVAGRVSARGALTLIDGGVYAADTSANSVALVRTAGQHGVTVYRDNRPVGTTDRHGVLLVRNLEPFQATKFSIDPTQLANDITISDVERRVRPMEHVGVAVDFDLAVSRAGQVRLVDAWDRPIAAGARARVDGAELPVGMDGLLYLPRIAADNHVIVSLPGGQLCVASFAGPGKPSPGAIIGPVRCSMQQIAVNEPFSTAGR